MDHILFWNGVALEANRRDFTDVPAGATGPSPEQGGPTLSSRALALVHLAMYDAHAGAKNAPAALPLYNAAVGFASAGADPAAAVAAAAHATLCALFPRQKPFFDERWAAAGLTGAAMSAGAAYGHKVAQALLALRGGDPGAGDAGYVPSLARGRHRRDPSNPGQPFHAPFYGARSNCWAVTARHELDAPPFDNAEYLRALRQVRAKGIAPQLMGTATGVVPKRTVDETLIGLFWAYDGVRKLGTPPRLYNLIVREVAMARGNDVDQNARLFALVNAAMADAGVLAWDQKYVHDLWRPVVGLREQDRSMGPLPATPTHNITDDCDPLWLPLGAPASNSSDRDFTPPFPAYPSGHATFGAAALHMARMFFGIAPTNRGPDTLFPGRLTSEELNGLTTDSQGVVRPAHARAFPGGLWQMIEENGFSRVFLGVHWSFDAFALNAQGQPDLTRNVGGVPLGLKIAQDIFTAGGGLAPRVSPVGPR